MRIVTGSALLATWTFATGCGPGPDAAAVSASVTDSAGVTIIQNPRPDTSRTVLVSPEPALKIGVVEGDVEYQLYQVSDVKRLSDGAIAVTNGGHRDLRIYEADGRHRVSAGRPGQGPAEFRYPIGMTILGGDTIRVQDHMDRVHFTSRGSFVRRETTNRDEVAEIANASGGYSEGIEWMADGSVVIVVDERMTGPPSPGPLYRPRMTFVRASATLDSSRVLGKYGGILQQFIDVGEGVRSVVPAYYSFTRWSRSPDDGTLVVADNANPQVERFAPDGTRTIVRWVAETAPPTSAEVEAWKDEQRAASWTQGQLPQLERAWAAMDLPETKPFYADAYAGSDGTVWISLRETTRAPTRLLAFTADGRYAGALTLPVRFTPYDSGPGWVLGVVRDENDVETVHLYRTTLE